MLRSFSNPFLTPDDFSVPCRLRRCEESCHEESDSDTSRQLDQQPEEMTCTMRKWHKETKGTFVSPHRRNASKSPTKEDDAELIFTPVQFHSRRRCLSGELTKVHDTNTPIPLSKRFASFGTPERIDPNDLVQESNLDMSVRSGTEPQFKEETTIPVKHIIKVLTRGESDKKPKASKKRSSSSSKKDASLKEECRQPPSICITTHSGSYELLMESTNEQLVLLTFLKVNTTNGKVVFVTEADEEQTSANPQTESNVDSVKPSGESTKNDVEEPTVMKEYQSMVIEPSPSNLSHGSSQSSGQRSFDVEALTAKTMAERLETETIAEKLERRFYRLVSSLDDLSSNVTKCACGCFGDSSVNNTVIEKELPRRRKNTASTVASDIEKLNLEVDPAISAEDSTAFDPAPMKTRNELLAESKMPSGLSVEHESEYLVDRVPCSGGNYYSTMITCDI